MNPFERSRRDFLSYSIIGGSCVALADPLAGNSLQTEVHSPFLATGSRFAVATAHPLATQAALKRFDQGGNAIDAAVAASLMLSVVDGHNSGLGGGGLALVRLSDGRVIALDGRETAPRRADPSQYVNESGQSDSQISQIGPKAAAVPGLVALLEQLASSYGVQDWKDSLLDAAETAEFGYEISGYFSKVIQANAAQLSKFPASARVLLDSEGQPWKAGHVLHQVDLARSLRRIAAQGSSWFYRGEFAAHLEKLMLDSGGSMRADDLADYSIISREPVVCDYRQNRVYSFPPPSSGGIHLVQMLGMLQHFDVAEVVRQSASNGYHLMLEVMKRAMADRAHWLGDADFADVPRGLIDSEYLRQMAEGIDLSKAAEVESYGIPPRADVDLFGRGGHTTHIAAADASGNVVALTQTVNTSFGSKMIVPGTGIFLNNEMDDFSLAAGVRNAFGLLGSEANKIEPGKRPLSSMTPTIIMDSSGRPCFSGGAAGGPRIITAVLQAVVRFLDLKMPIEQAIAAPRVHHQWSPNRAVIESKMPDEIVAELERLGHPVQRVDSVAVAQAIAFDSPRVTATSDPRVPSAAGAG